MPSVLRNTAKVIERWISLAVPTGATDLHIDVRRNTARVRVRVDGRIEPLPDGQGGRYSRKEVVDAIAAGYNSTRKGNNVSQYNAEQFADCMIDLDLPGTGVFHGGTKTEGNQVLTSGGRVLSVTAWAADLASARELAYQRVAKIHFAGSQYRRDIAARLTLE